MCCLLYRYLYMYAAENYSIVCLCHDVDQRCGPPSGVENSQYADGVQPTSTLVGAKVSYVCARGYEFDTEDGEIECLPTLRWSAPPYCISMFQHGIF